MSPMDEGTTFANAGRVRWTVGAGGTRKRCVRNYRRASPVRLQADGRGGQRARMGRAASGAQTGQRDDGSVDS